MGQILRWRSLQLSQSIVNGLYQSVPDVSWNIVRNNYIITWAEFQRTHFACRKIDI